VGRSETGAVTPDERARILAQLFDEGARLRGVETARALAVADARRLGASWVAIAHVLDVTPAEAQDRYGHGERH
jgi:hypothetical protein